MKKKDIIIIITILLIVISVLTYFIVKDNRVTKDEKKFRMEYENYNKKKVLATKQSYPKVKIPEKNGIKYATSKKIIELLSEGTGVIYFGFPQCPWCRSMIVPFIEVMQESNEDIYYFNAYAIRDEKYLNEDNEIATAKEGTKEYYKILDLLGDKASIYDGLNDDSIKRLYFPTVVFVRNGKIVDIHVSTVDSQKDGFKKLNKNQIKELKKIYRRGIKNLHKVDNSVVCKGRDSC